MKDGDKIILDGKVVTVYLCDRQDKCRNSKYCGKECKYTFKKERRAQQLPLFKQTKRSC